LTPCRFEIAEFDRWAEMNTDGKSMRAVLRLLAFVAAGPAWAQSFDCATTKSAPARLICGDAELSKADAEMAKAFKAGLGRADSGEKDAFLKDQAKWKQDRNKRCGLDQMQMKPLSELMAAKPCMLEAISQRTAQLAPPAKTETADTTQGVAARAIAAPSAPVASPAAQATPNSRTFCRWKRTDDAEAKLTVFAALAAADSSALADENALRAYVKDIGAAAEAYCLNEQKMARLKETILTPEGRFRETPASDNMIPDRIEVFIGDLAKLPGARKVFAVSSDAGSFWTIIEPAALK
jgi:uncharacterized protein YecT (DUF1311 family)